jgi:hypothetical protein
MKLAEEEWEQTDTRLPNTAKTVNERRAEKVSRTLSGGAIHCLVGSDIVRYNWTLSDWGFLETQN